MWNQIAQVYDSLEKSWHWGHPAQPCSEKKIPDAQAHFILLNWSSQDSQGSFNWQKGTPYLKDFEYVIWQMQALLLTKTEQGPARLIESWQGADPRLTWASQLWWNSFRHQTVIVWFVAWNHLGALTRHTGAAWPADAQLLFSYDFFV